MSLDPQNTPQPQAAPPRAEVARVAVRLPASQPVVVYVIIGLTVLVYVLQELSSFLIGSDLPALYGMKINAAIIAGQYWRLITPVLLHGSILHILFNMYALYAIGRQLERSYGHLRFLLLYLVAGLAGNAASFVISANNSLGASTAVFGLIAAEGLFIYSNRRLFGEQGRTMLANIGGVILINLMLGFTTSGIDNWGHLGGLAGGALFALLAGPVYIVAGQFPDLKLVDKRTTLLAVLVALVESAATLLLISPRLF